MSVFAETRLNADAMLLITNSLPILPSGHCSGILTITNTGTMPFMVVTNLNRADMPIYFRKEFTRGQEDADDHFRGGEQRKLQQKFQLIEYYTELIKTDAARSLLPNEHVTIPVPYFTFEGDGEIYKSELYIGNGTWVSVNITPAIGHAKRVVGQNNSFWYSKEGTNQYLYLKDGNQFKRIGEMKTGTKPKATEDGVIFYLPDGSTHQVTRATAMQIIENHEKIGKKDE